MPDFKKDWPSLLYKVLMAVLAVIFGYNQYQTNQQHAVIQVQMESLMAHTDYLEVDGEE